jgi:hypothetical protein
MPAKTNSELAREIEELRHRVEDLESQNRALAELLNAVKAKLVALPDSAQPDEREAAARAHPVTVAPPRASASTETAAAKISSEHHALPPAAKRRTQSARQAAANRCTGLTSSARKIRLSFTAFCGWISTSTASAPTTTRRRCSSLQLTLASVSRMLAIS